MQHSEKSISNDSSWSFAPRRSVEEVEEGFELAPKFNEADTLPCITQHVETGEVLMFAYMNPEALRRTVDQGYAHYWSRSRQKLWLKGETSGMRQKVHQILVDDDQDCVILKVSLTSPDKGGSEASCHVGYRSCFYRAVTSGLAGPKLTFIEREKVFDPHLVYEGVGNPTQL